MGTERMDPCPEAGQVSVIEKENNNKELQNASDTKHDSTQDDVKTSSLGSETNLSPIRHPTRRRIAPKRFKDYEYADTALTDDEPSSDSSTQTPFRIFTSSRPRGRPRKSGRDHTYQVRQSSDTNADNESCSQAVAADSGSVGDTPPSNRRFRASPFDEGMLKRPRIHRCLKTDCGQTFLRLSTLLKHNATMHSESGEPRVGRPASARNEDPAKLRPFKCLTCGKTFAQKNNLKAHSALHSGEKPYNCDESGCKQSFRSAESLKNHKRKHLGIKLYQCQMCDTKCTSNQALKEHILRHTDSKPYVCSICNRSFRQVSCYSRHLTTHSDEKPFSCHVCGKKFSQLAYVRSHLKSHTGEKPFACSQCGKRFAHQSDKSRHEIIHTGKKPFECDVCGAKFNDASSCRRHIREHSSATVISCQLCGENFRKVNQLKAHMNKTHSKQSNVDVSTSLAEGGSLVAEEVNVAGNNDDIHQHIMEEISRTLSGVEGPVAYQILHEDDRQQVVEIHYNIPPESDQTTQQNAVEIHYNVATVSEQSVQHHSQVIEQSHDQSQSHDQLQSHDDVQARASSESESIQRRNGGMPISVGAVLSDQGDSFNQTHVEVINDDVSEPRAESQPMLVIQPNSVIDARSLDQSLIQNAQEISCVMSRELHTMHPREVLAVESPQDNQTSQAMCDSDRDEWRGSISDNNALSSTAVTSAQAVAITQPVNDSLDEHAGSLVHTSGGQNCPPPTENADTCNKGQESVHQISEVVHQEHVTQTGFIFTSSSDLDVTSNDDLTCTMNVEEGLQALESSTGADFVTDPDFNSQNYYNWLSSFCELVKLLQLPIEVSLFQKISRVHKSLADVLANPSGVLQDKANFKILMSLSSDLNAVINAHLQHVLMSFDS